MNNKGVADVAAIMVIAVLLTIALIFRKQILYVINWFLSL